MTVAIGSFLVAQADEIDRWSRGGRGLCGNAVQLSQIVLGKG